MLPVKTWKFIIFITPKKIVKIVSVRWRHYRESEIIKWSKRVHFCEMRAK